MKKRAPRRTSLAEAAAKRAEEAQKINQHIAKRASFDPDPNLDKPEPKSEPDSITAKHKADATARGAAKLNPNLDKPELKSESEPITAEHKADTTARGAAELNPNLDKPEPESVAGMMPHAAKPTIPRQTASTSRMAGASARVAEPATCSSSGPTPSPSTTSLSGGKTATSGGVGPPPTAEAVDRQKAAEIRDAYLLGKPAQLKEEDPEVENLPGLTQLLDVLGGQLFKWRKRAAGAVESATVEHARTAAPTAAPAAITTATAAPTAAPSAAPATSASHSQPADAISQRALPSLPKPTALPKPSSMPSIAEPPLPKGWRVRKAPDGRPYYYHVETRQVQWGRPSLDQSPPAEPPSAAEPSSHNTPDMSSPSAMQSPTDGVRMPTIGTGGVADRRGSCGLPGPRQMHEDMAGHIMGHVSSALPEGLQPVTAEPPTTPMLDDVGSEAYQQSSASPAHRPMRASPSVAGDASHDRRAHPGAAIPTLTVDSLPDASEASVLPFHREMRLSVGEVRPASGEEPTDLQLALARGAALAARGFFVTEVEREAEEEERDAMISSREELMNQVDELNRKVEKLQAEKLQAELNRKVEKLEAKRTRPSRSSGSSTQDTGGARAQATRGGGNSLGRETPFLSESQLRAASMRSLNVDMNTSFSKKTAI